MHNGFLNIDNEKMSKSLGNFFTTREVLAKIKHPEVLRFFLLSSHYRGPMNYSPDQLVQAEAGLNRLYTALRDVPVAATFEPSNATSAFHDAMDDDFNTPDAMAVLQGLATEINTSRDDGKLRAAERAGAELRNLGAVLGFLNVPADRWFHGADTIGQMGKAEIEAQLSARIAARKAKNWPEADRIRDALAAAGILFEDKPNGETLWRRK
jgi:cysteinyl-tRNA synthetase